MPQEEIYPNPNQPRKRFDFDELEGLAQSIRQNGIIQPIAVRINAKGNYELISGERRLRAARMIGNNIKERITGVDIAEKLFEYCNNL